MTETGELTAEPKKRGSLNAMRIADLKTMAGGLGVAGADAMRKAALVEAIKAAQGSGGGGGGGVARAKQAPAEQAPAPERAEVSDQPEKPDRHRKQDQPPKRVQRDTSPAPDQADGQRQKQGQQKQGQQTRTQHNAAPDQKQDQKPDQKQDQEPDADDDGTGSRRNRRRRGRDNRDTGNQRGARRNNEPDTQVLDDDVLVPAAGILDVLENYAFVRTSGYLPGTEDVYLSLSLVRKFGLRRGDAVTGQVRQPREGERREKFNPMVRIDSVNSQDPDTARTRPEFDELTAVHPTERIRLETSGEDLAGRVLDLAVPIGKGQRCLVRASPRSGRTSLLRSLARSVTTSCPEAHLMVVLLHERPEEVTDVRREVAGEVVASTFDRQPADHVGVAELAIERAKRLVELGHDVVVLTDGLSRLARAHDQAGGGGPRTTAGGVDASALLPPKRLFGAARALEEGGSLTVVATVSVDTGVAADELVAEELEGTANAEIRLSGSLAAAGLHPAVDLSASGTRHEDLLLGAEERDAVGRLRRVLADRGDASESLGLLLERLRATRTNIDLLTRVTKEPASRRG